MRECIRSPSNPHAFDSPETHCVPSLVCPKTPRDCLFAVKFLHLLPSKLLVFADSPSELFTFAHTMGFRISDEGTRSLAIKSHRVRFPQTHCVPSLVCPKTLCVSIPSNSLCLLIPPSNPSRSLALKTLHVCSRNGL